jgi:hypothetical protein
MRSFRILPVVAGVLFAAACGGGATAVDTTAKVRFFNATTGMSGSGGFTANGQFVAGSALAFGQSSQTCATVDQGTMSIAFGAANAGGTALTGNALATLNGQTLAGGGNYTMVATGSAASPQLYLVDNNYSGPIGSGQAVARFLNLAPGPNSLPYIFYAFSSWPPSQDGALFAGSLLVGAPSAFKTAASGPSTVYTIIGHDMETLDNHPVNLQAGTVNTLAIVPNASGRFQVINVPRC